MKYSLLLRDFLLFTSPSCWNRIKYRRLDSSSSPWNSTEADEFTTRLLWPWISWNQWGMLVNVSLSLQVTILAPNWKHLCWSGERVTLLTNKSEIVWLLSRPERIWILHSWDKCNFLLHTACWNGPGFWKVWSWVTYKYAP